MIVQAHPKAGTNHFTVQVHIETSHLNQSFDLHEWFKFLVSIWTVSSFDMECNNRLKWVHLFPIYINRRRFILIIQFVFKKDVDFILSYLSFFSKTFSHRMIVPCKHLLVIHVSVSKDLFKVNNKNKILICGICSKYFLLLTLNSLDIFM